MIAPSGVPGDEDVTAEVLGEAGDLRRLARAFAPFKNDQFSGHAAVSLSCRAAW
jgi:hypothetical protein